MTNIEKIKKYYSEFDEWKRLETPEGKLEFDVVLNIIQKYIKPGSSIFDLGGGPGRYTATLSKHGYKMHLADLSKELIQIAKEKIKQFGDPANIIQIDVCNALDLSAYSENSFDAVLLFGPLYHLTSEKETQKCLTETKRVLKENGILFAIFIPWITGLTGIVERAFFAPDHVNPDSLLKTYEEGIFNNQSEYGFQEGAYIKSSRIEELFSLSGFNKILLRSIRGIGNKQEKNLLALKEKDPKYYDTMLKIIEDTASEVEVVETCGHAIFVGQKY